MPIDSTTPVPRALGDLSKRSLAAARRVMERCELLAACSDHPSQLTRTFCSPAMAAAHGMLRGWMTEARMTSRLDPVGNLIGRFAAASEDESPSKVLLVGSHLDTVIDAGKYDGPLGVLIGLAAVELIRDGEFSPPFAMDVIGFCEEEGIRYRTPFIGSRWLTSAFEQDLLDRVDDQGIKMRLALEEFCDERGGPEFSYDPDRVVGFIEPHIEQGPVLDREDLPIGIVESIASQMRASIRFSGCAGHSGTAPMALRRDALAGAAEWIFQIEHMARQISGAVATVGRIVVAPNVSNVIPNEVYLTLDARHNDDLARTKLVAEMLDRGVEITSRRKLSFSVDSQEHFPAISMDDKLSELLSESAIESAVKARCMSSGAGHDAGVMARKFPAAMLFVRCREGISHHPDESVRVEDVAVALEVLVRVIYKLAVKEGQQ